MAKERLSRLQKYILQESHGWHGRGVPLIMFMVYWKRLDSDFNWDDKLTASGIRKYKEGMSLHRSIQNMEKKGLIHVGADEEMSISLTEEGKFIAGCLPPVFPDQEAKYTIRRLKFSPPKVSRQGSGPNPGDVQLLSRMQGITKGVRWLTNQIRELQKDREFWGEESFRRSLEREGLSCALRGFILTIKELANKAKPEQEEEETNNKTLNAHGKGKS
jgi:hypothetical protein